MLATVKKIKSTQPEPAKCLKNEEKEKWECFDLMCK